MSLSALEMGTRTYIVSFVLRLQSDFGGTSKAQGHQGTEEEATSLAKPHGWA